MVKLPSNRVVPERLIVARWTGPDERGTMWTQRIFSQKVDQVAKWPAFPHLGNVNRCLEIFKSSEQKWPTWPAKILKINYNIFFSLTSSNLSINHNIVAINWTVLKGPMSHINHNISFPPKRNEFISIEQTNRPEKFELWGTDRPLFFLFLLMKRCAPIVNKRLSDVIAVDFELFVAFFNYFPTQTADNSTDLNLSRSLHFHFFKNYINFGQNLGCCLNLSAYLS
jgi:hypothetical protein